jgi:hypothetical protein
MPLLSFVYQFVIGGAIFFLGIFLSWRAKDYSFKKKDDRKTLFFMVGAFGFYFIFQLLWHLAGAEKI